MFDDEILSYIDHSVQSLRDSNNINIHNKISNPYHMNNHNSYNDNNNGNQYVGDVHQDIRKSHQINNSNDIQNVGCHFDFLSENILI